MSSYLRPRRGKKATAEAQLTSSTPLKRGEIFFEVPTGGVGTGLGKIKMGDGATGYSSLPYFLEQLDPDNAKVAFTDSSTPSSNPYAANTTLATAIAPTASLKTIFTNLKQLLVNHNSQLTSLNNDLTCEYNRQLTSSDDLNNIKTPGNYKANSNVINLPNELNDQIIFIKVEKLGGYILQTCTGISITVNTYRRYYSSHSNKWLDWYKVVDEAVGIFKLTDQQSSATNTVTFTLKPENINVCNGFIFSTTWSNPTTPLRGSIYWIRFRTSSSDEPVGVYQMFINTGEDEQDSKFTITSVTYDSSTGLLTITYQSSVVRFTELIYG